MKRKARRGRDRGTAAVELAILLPVLLLVLSGIIDFGRLLYVKMELSTAAREAARVVAVGHPEDAQARANAAVNLASGPVNAAATTTCPNSAEIGTATVTYRFEWITPIGDLTDMFGGNAMGDGMDVSARGSMQCGG